MQLDVTDDSSAGSAADAVANAGGLDVLINNAGISDRTPVVATEAADVGRVLDTNVLGPVRVPRAFTPKARAHPRWRVNSADPGFTATDFNQHRGIQTVEEGTDVIVALATIGSDGPTGTVRDRNGVVPW